MAEKDVLNAISGMEDRTETRITAIGERLEEKIDTIGDNLHKCQLDRADRTAKITDKINKVDKKADAAGTLAEVAHHKAGSGARFFKFIGVLIALLAAFATVWGIAVK